MPARRVHVATAGRRAQGGAASDLVTFALGALLVGVGTGIGLPHAAKAGPALLTFVGVAALVIGLLATGFGAVRLARRAHGWRRFLMAPLLLVVTALLVYLVALPLAVTVVPATSSSRTPASVGLAYRDVTVPTPDGVALSAWYVVPATGASARSAVVLLHGAGSTKASTLDQGKVLADHGYAVLMLDARGHGDSAGRAMDWGWHGDQDVDGAVSFLAGRPEVDPAHIAVVGLSMGGEEAVGAAASDGRIRAVVAEGATGRGAADLRWLSDVYGWRGGVQEGLMTVHTALVDVLTDASPPLTLQSAAARAAPRPILLITAGDRADELHAASRIQRAARGNVQVWTVPGSGHTAGLATSPAEWEQRVVAFLDAATS